MCFVSLQLVSLKLIYIQDKIGVQYDGILSIYLFIHYYFLPVSSVNDPRPRTFFFLAQNPDAMNVPDAVPLSDYNDTAMIPTLQLSLITCFSHY
jgi:hypothetical protein